MMRKYITAFARRSHINLPARRSPFDRGWSTRPREPSADFLRAISLIGEFASLSVPRASSPADSRARRERGPT